MATSTTPPTARSSLFPIPEPLVKFFSQFPLYTYPSSHPPSHSALTAPTLWILPPPASTDTLSADVECLKWQAHLALRGIQSIRLRWDVSVDGALGGRLPNLQVPSTKARDAVGELLAAHNIPAWIDEQVGALDELEGYRDVEARDESHAWIALLEGDVHAALAVAQPSPSFFYQAILQLPPSTAQRPVETLLTPPPAPLSGLTSLLPTYGARVPVQAIYAKYRDAIAVLSERLGSDEWFLGSRGPTALDALAFAYLRTLLHASDDLRIEVARRVNLVHWERRVHERVRAASSSSATGPSS
ncbi:hypothetical protein FA95DRAFT_1565217 [Auriscalpium vulgare]|uniref:Uncharacterized protein n=1 Tax=Auriscalpium vulgare TaxID=40419 RepID=A0ACB8RBR9_9AGAM|nr:hypothetical protein FA95DRAFT_1565217 [Auriscalpium vulgare]